MKLLIADDSKVSRHLLEAILREWRYEVVVACDGIKAWTMLREDRDISIAILDWMMPGLTGPEVCKLIRSQLAPTRYVYTVILTSKALRQDVVAGLESGADDYLVKPFDQHELRVRLRAGQRILDFFGVAASPLKPIEFYSCFISYSSKDEEFASRLHADLVDNDVSCFYAPEDLRSGDKFRFVIDESIKLHDKLLLILSEASIDSRWVESEVEAALEDEQRRIQTRPPHLRGNVTVLFPIRIDNAPFHATQAWVADVRRQRHIGDFRDWQNSENYLKAFARLTRDLKRSDALDKKAVATRKRIAENMPMELGHIPGE